MFSVGHSDEHQGRACAALLCLTLLGSSYAWNFLQINGDLSPNLIFSPLCLTLDTLQVISTASAASSMVAAESALRELETLLAKDQAPFSSTLHRLRTQLLLQLGRCRHMPAPCLPCTRFL